MTWDEIIERLEEQACPAARWIGSDAWRELAGEKAQERLRT